MEDDEVVVVGSIAADLVAAVAAAAIPLPMLPLPLFEAGTSAITS
jgi:hypothetical protein